MAPSYATIPSVSARLVAEQSSARKLAKYSKLAISHALIPIAKEFFGPTCTEALTFLSELGRRISVYSHRRHARNNFPFPTSIHSH